MGAPSYNRFGATSGGGSYSNRRTGFRYEASLMQRFGNRNAVPTVAGNATRLRSLLTRAGYYSTSIRVGIVSGVAQMQITGQVDPYIKQDSFSYINNEITGLARQAGYEIFGSGTSPY